MNETRMARRRGDLRDVRRAVGADGCSRPDVRGRPRPRRAPRRAASLGAPVHSSAAVRTAGYVGSCRRPLRPGAKRRLRTAVAGLLESKAYRRLSADRALPIAARTYLCRSWIDERARRSRARAHGSAVRRVGVRRRRPGCAPPASCARQALAYWEEAREAGTPPTRSAHRRLRGDARRDAAADRPLRRERRAGGRRARAPGRRRRRRARDLLHRRSRGARGPREPATWRRLRGAADGRARSAPGLARAGHRVPRER